MRNFALSELPQVTAYLRLIAQRETFAFGVRSECSFPICLYFLLRIWQSNEGSLGFAKGKQHQFTPISILELAHKPGDGEKVVSVASGNNHLLILTTHGTVFTLGAGDWGQLWRMDLERRKIHGTHPEKIVIGTWSRKAVTIGAGNYHSFAVDDQGVVWGWGLNTMGQSGETVVEIAGGEHHTLFHEAFKDREYPDFFLEPLQVKFPHPTDRVIHISAGTHSNIAVTEGGAVYSWGEGNQGELHLSQDRHHHITSIGAGSLGYWWSWMAWVIGWTRSRFCMISKARKIGIGVCFLGWSASRHSGLVELWSLFTAFLLNIFLIFVQNHTLLRGTAKISEVKILIWWFRKISLYESYLHDKIYYIKWFPVGQGRYLRKTHPKNKRTLLVPNCTNKTINQAIRFHVNWNQKGWVCTLPRIRFCMMNIINSSAGYSGFQLRLGPSPRVIPPIVPTSLPDNLCSAGSSAEKI